MRTDSHSSDPLIQKLHDMEARGEIDKLRAMVRYYEGIEALGAMGTVLKNIVITVSVIAAGYYAFLTWFRGAAP